MNLSRVALRSLLVCASAAVLTACGGGGGDDDSNGYKATILVSDTSSGAYSSRHVDAKLVNAWGIAFNPDGFVWVANAGTSTSTLYDGNGVPQSLVVDIPAGTAGEAEPTGIVFNGSDDFVVSDAGKSGASRFIFVGEGGTVAAWSMCSTPTSRRSPSPADSSTPTCRPATRHSASR